jgi:hypothetical protein
MMSEQESSDKDPLALSPGELAEAIDMASSENNLGVPVKPRKRVQVKNDPSFDTKPSKMRPESLEGLNASAYRAFGAVIITRPFFSLSEMDKYRVYTINPGIVRSWMGPPKAAAKKFLACIPETQGPDSDVRLLYNVNEFRVRSSPARQQYPKRGFADLSWTEQSSGNEFIVFSELWNNQS